jgi:hypothetical protein
MPRPKKVLMQWKRKQLRGISAKKRKEWYSDGKKYRIVWNAEYLGIDLTQHYGALYHASIGPQTEDEVGWNRITSAGKIYRTLKAAQRACEVHKKDSEAKNTRRTRKKRTR